MDTLDRSQPYDVVCFGAHPDDVEMGMGGTLASLIATGARAAIVDLTGGELGTHGDRATREKESAEAARRLGVDRVILDFPDGGVVDDLAGRHRLVRILRELRPSLIFAPWPHARAGWRDGRSNVDHLAAGMLVREASKLARFRKLLPELDAHETRRLLYYMIPDEVRPSYVVDISQHEEALRAAIGAHESQMKISRSGRDPLDFLFVWRRQVGMRLGVSLAEAFRCEDALGGEARHLLEI